MQIDVHVFYVNVDTSVEVCMLYALKGILLTVAKTATHLSSSVAILRLIRAIEFKALSLV